MEGTSPARGGLMKTIRQATLVLAIIAIWANSIARAEALDLTATNWAEWVSGVGNFSIPLNNDGNEFLYFDFPVEDDTTCSKNQHCHAMRDLLLPAAHLQITNITGYSLRLKVNLSTTDNPHFEWKTENKTCSDL